MSRIICKLHIPRGCGEVRAGEWGGIYVSFRKENLCGAIYVVHYTLPNLKSSSPLLAQTSHPPTRNLSGKTHDAGQGDATDDDFDDGILNADDRLLESLMKLNAMTLLGRAR